MSDHIITCPHDLLRIAFLTIEVGATEDRAKELCSKYMYKFTTCGANITFRDTGVTIGSVVEGSEQETQYIDLEYPFSDETWHDAVEAIEDEAAAIWDMVNDPDMADIDWQ